MKKNILFAAFIVSLLLLGGEFSFAIAYGLGPQSPYELYLDVDTPPILLYVKDAQGRISGAGPNLPVNAAGMQPALLNSLGLNEIPDSYVEQDNFDIKGPAHPPTDWVIHIFGDGPQTYTAFCKGIAFGFDFVDFEAEYWTHIREGNDEEVTLLVSPQVTRKLKVQFNPESQILKITRIVAPGDLLNDVQSACEQNLISSDRVCRHLKLEAKLIEVALNHHREEEAEHLARNFLWSLGIRKESHFFDIDRDHEEKDDTYIKQPVLSVLQQDAQALLTQIEQGKVSESNHHYSRGKNGNH